MTFTGPLIFAGFLDELTMPGDAAGSTARFRLTVSPTHDGTDDLVLPCRVTDPVMAHAVLHDLAPGDQLRVTGYLHLPCALTEPMFLAVSKLHVLEAALLLEEAAALPALRLVTHPT
ncbi:hypothetical protein [Streptomyces lydicamycinicus]|uniref:hypothetical protein n=1 Tax=Streptomyces lydicamycinicus TaxID=1546107 RepID=UPI003C2D42EA